MFRLRCGITENERTQWNSGRTVCEVGSFIQMLQSVLF